MSHIPRDWLAALTRLLQREAAVVRIVIAGVRGSAPREPGAFMLVGRDCVEGTIGGGRLEWESMAAARELLGATTAAARLNKIVLGADVGQCCGGVVAVWLERFTREDLGLLHLATDAGARGPAVLSTTIKGASVEHRLVCGAEIDEATDRYLRSSRERAHLCTMRSTAEEVTFLERLDDTSPELWLYGAGHVGQALARILVDLPLRLTWLDPRKDMFPATVPEGVRIRCDADLLASVSEAPVGAYFLVMTHSHPLDYALCQAVLLKSDFAWLGLIGSESKAARFRSRLAREGMSAESISRLVCPIGIGGIESKWPAAIAVGVAAQVMQQISVRAAESEQRTSPERIATLEAPGRYGRAERFERSERLGRAQAFGLAADSLRPTGVADCSPENCSRCGVSAS
jgi:xanthine dehydrogenase accessory factor